MEDSFRVFGKFYKAVKAFELRKNIRRNKKYV